MDRAIAVPSMVSTSGREAVEGSGGRRYLYLTILIPLQCDFVNPTCVIAYSGLDIPSPSHSF